MGIKLCAVVSVEVAVKGVLHNLHDPVLDTLGIALFTLANVVLQISMSSDFYRTFNTPIYLGIHPIWANTLCNFATTGMWLAVAYAIPRAASAAPFW